MLVRRAGLVCLWGGLLGAASGIALAVVPPAVEPDVYGYPLGPTAFTLIHSFFFVQHLALVLGLLALWRSGALGKTRLGPWGTGTAVVGMTLLALTELAAIPAANAPYPSPHTDILDTIYGVASMVIGIGLVLTGIAVLRAGLWQGWQRFLPLLLGVYVFVPMTPAIFGPFVLARLAISGWMLLFALLGWELARRRSHRAEQPAAVPGARLQRDRQRTELANSSSVIPADR